MEEIKYIKILEYYCSRIRVYRIFREISNDHLRELQVSQCCYFPRSFYLRAARIKVSAFPKHRAQTHLSMIYYNADDERERENVCLSSSIYISLALLIVSPWICRSFAGYLHLPAHNGIFIWIISLYEIIIYLIYQDWIFNTRLVSHKVLRKSINIYQWLKRRGTMSLSESGI